MRRLLLASALLISTCAQLSSLPGFAADNAPAGPSSVDSVEGKVWQAEEWVKSKNSPWLTPADGESDKKKHKGPVRNFIKAVAKGTAKELGTSAEDFAKDMVLVFSVQDIDPYEQKGVPTKRPAIILKFTMADGSNAYLRRFPDGSYAIEDGFANGTVLIPRRDKDDYLVKYPNDTRGRMAKDNTGTVRIYRPDQTVTTVAKTASGGYSVSNTKFGYMGDARPDSTGINYESGQW